MMELERWNQVTGCGRVFHQMFPENRQLGPFSDTEGFVRCDESGIIASVSLFHWDFEIIADSHLPYSLAPTAL